MISQLVLVVGDEGVLCSPFNISGAPAPFFAMHNDKASSNLILGLAARYAYAPVTVLADTLSVDIKRDNLQARLNPFDRAKLTRRRLQQAFPQARVRASINVKSSRARILLAGLQNEGAALLWLDRLAAVRPKNIPRLSLLPLECADLAAKLLPAAREGWAMLLSWQRGGGFRQIVTHNGEAVFTRLTPPLAADAGMAELVATITRDIKASRGYLARIGLADKTPLRAVLILPEAVHEALRVAELPLHQPLLISPHEAAWKLGLPSAPLPADPYSDWIFACRFAQKKKPSLVLLPPELLRRKRNILIARWGMKAAAAALVLSLGFAASDANDLVSTLMTERDETAQLTDLQKQLSREQKAAEPVTEPLGKLRQALERDHLYSAPMPSPRTALTALNEGLGAEARLTKVDWQNDSGKPADETIVASVKLMNAPNISDRETTVARFQAVAKKLSRAMPNYAVSVSRYPFPALPQETLSNGGKDDKPAAEPTADFSIKRNAL